MGRQGDKMKTQNIKITDDFEEFYKALDSNGAFLVVRDKSGKTNLMTIGWATLGIVWHEPIMTVFVRPSRHTFELMENAEHFSVCVPVNKLEKELAFCGSKSGRNMDKFKEFGLTPANGQTPGTSIVEECDIFYECEIVHATNVLEETLEHSIKGAYYPNGDFHAIYFGKVSAAYRKA